MTPRPRRVRYGPPPMIDVDIRPAGIPDVPRVAALAAELVRMHHDADPARFFMSDNVESGYARWLPREIARAGAVVLVASASASASASEGAAIHGYAYGALEERDWMRLLDAHGAVHDIFVARESRRAGIGRKLLDALVLALEQRGAPRIVLSTMAANEAAQHLFRQAGFRPTMLEMTK
jgi:ribosomal protein S18 acetylase RimI-like enzyme